MRAKMVFVSTPLLPVVQAAAAEVASVKQIIVAGGGPDQLPRLEALLAAEREAAAPAATCVDEVAYWLYSSGTTGMPKGIMHVYSSPMYMARLAGERLGIREDDLVFSAAKAFLPMDLYGPGNSIVCPGSIEATSILYPERPTLQTVFETLRSHQPTMFYGVPTLYAAILAAPNCVPEMSSSRLRLCFSAGKPLPEHIGHSWKARFGLDIVKRGRLHRDGTFILDQSTRRGGLQRLGSGRGGLRSQACRRGGREIADGEFGELLVRGPSAAAGYRNQRERTRCTFQGEWTRTGDKYTRGDGVYTYSGRTDDMFKVSGIWVLPFEVEAVLVSHPSVLEAAVVAAEDADGLTKPKAFVVLKPGVGDSRSRALYEDLKVHVKRSIGPWKYPRWIEFVDSLPKTAIGKIQRYLLRGH